MKQTTVHAVLGMMLLACGACSAADGGPSATDESLSGRNLEALSTADIVGRAREWVNVAMPYCGGPNGGADVLCGGTCVRTGAAKNPAWDAYRSDCSGLVSYAWGLPAPGRITSTLPEVATPIAGTDLAPGDILNNSYHVVLFVEWVNKAAGTAKVIHEPDCGRVASEVQVVLTVNSSSSVSLWSDGYTALRSNNAQASPAPGGGGNACGDLTYQGKCDGNALSWCENGGVRSYDCAAAGKECVWESDSVGYNCVVPAVPPPPDVPVNNCGGLDYLGKCDGNTLVWCQEGQLKSFDCSGSAQTCAWQSDTEGFNCLSL